MKKFGFWVCCWLWVSVIAQADQFEFFHENVLGTSFQLTIRVDSVETATAIESAALSEIDRLNQIFSAHDPESELIQFARQPAGANVVVSPELADALRLAMEWTKRSDSAFHPGAESLFALWKQAARHNQRPSRESLNAEVALLTDMPWAATGSDNAFRRIGNGRFSLNAMAEGIILDAVAKRIRTNFRFDQVVLNLGGEALVLGEPANIGIRDPRSAADNQPPLTFIPLQNQSLSTSGGYRRFLAIQGESFSHVVDPRTGTPVAHILSSTVLASDTTTADILATICSVLQPDQSVALVDSIPGAACLLVDHLGQTHTSLRWPQDPVKSGGKEAEQADKQFAQQDPETHVDLWNGGRELIVDLEINQAGGGGRYRRPYVAVWVEDKDGFPVKTLALWVQSTGPGPRWIPDLRKWYKSDALRRMADNTDLVATISEATHKPGQYQLAWNGQDDHGKLVEPGEYTIMIEAAREHGTYQLIKQKLNLQEQDLSEEPKGNTEIKSAKFVYQTKKSSSDDKSPPQSQLKTP